MDADAEHQQDDADLGELRGKLHVGDEPRGEWPNRHPRQQVADDHGQTEALGNHPADERGGEPHGDGCDQLRLMGHRDSGQG